MRRFQFLVLTAAIAFSANTGWAQIDLDADGVPNGGVSNTLTTDSASVDMVDGSPVFFADSRNGQGKKPKPTVLLPNAGATEIDYDPSKKPMVCAIYQTGGCSITKVTLKNAQGEFYQKNGGTTTYKHTFVITVTCVFPMAVIVSHDVTVNIISVDKELGKDSPEQKLAEKAVLEQLKKKCPPPKGPKVLAPTTPKK